MVYFSFVIILLSLLVITIMVVLTSVSNKLLTNLTIKQRLKIDNISLLISGLLSLGFIIGILASFHVFDKTYFDNRYDYRYHYETLDSTIISGEFDEYKNIGKINLKDTELYVMAFRETDSTGLPNNVYYQIKVISDIDYNYEVICNGTTYMNLYSSSTNLHILNNDELALFCEDGDMVQVKIINDNETMYEMIEFEYNLQFVGFSSLPNVKTINDLHPVMMMFVFIVFFYLVFKKINYYHINSNQVVGSKPIISKIALGLISVSVLISLILLANHDDQLNISNTLKEKDIYLIDTVSTAYGNVDIKYNYLTDTLYFRVSNLNESLSLVFDDTIYVDTRSLDFGTLEELGDNWYTIENSENSSNLSIVIYDSNSPVDTILVEELVSLVHPYLE